MVYAVIETGGKQYKVKENDELYVEKLSAKDGEKVVLKSVAIFRDGKIFLDDSGVEASVLKSGKWRKMVVFTYKAIFCFGIYSSLDYNIYFKRF